MTVESSPRVRLRDRWPTLVGILVVPVFLFTGAWQGFVGAALCYVLFAAFRGERRTTPWVIATVVAFIAFGALNTAALVIGDPTLRHLAAAGWLAHGVWDLVHHRANRIAPRWWAELCLVADVLIAVALVFAPHLAR
jgi:hypothetical protein